MLLRQARTSLDESPQWTAQLCDYLIALDYMVGEAKMLKADAVDKLGEALLTATGRNYYFTSARQLRSSDTAGTAGKPQYCFYPAQENPAAPATAAMEFCRY